MDKYTKDMEEYLSDEFRLFIAGKQVKFTESDIEKVSKWQIIYYNKWINLWYFPKRGSKNSKKKGKIFLQVFVQDILRF